MPLRVSKGANNPMSSTNSHQKKKKRQKFFLLVEVLHGGKISLLKREEVAAGTRREKVDPRSLCRRRKRNAPSRARTRTKAPFQLIRQKEKKREKNRRGGEKKGRLFEEGQKGSELISFFAGRKKEEGGR